jgi:hypothetical protein
VLIGQENRTGRFEYNLDKSQKKEFLTMKKYVINTCILTLLVLGLLEFLSGDAFAGVPTTKNKSSYRLPENPRSVKLTVNKSYRIPGSQRMVTLKAGTTVLLDENGCVTNGILAADTSLTVKQGQTPVMFMGEKGIGFWPSGNVSQGFLKNDTSLDIPPGDTKVLFMKNILMSFDMWGNVSSGTLVKATTLKVPEKYGSQRMFKAGARVTFNRNGIVSVYREPR